MTPKRLKKNVQVIPDTDRFLVQLASGLYFLKTAGDGKPLGVRHLSVAAHLSYEQADGLCQQFRSMGYNGPVVVDIFGRMVDFDALAAERRAQDERIARFWGE